MDNTNLSSLDPKLARLLRQAAREGQDLWEGYDPEGVRAAVRCSAALGTTAEPADLDPMIAQIRAQRDQTSSDFSA